MGVVTFGAVVGDDATAAVVGVAAAAAFTGRAGGGAEQPADIPTAIATAARSAMT
ncbi:hypothetical protein [Terrabacter carboxydivorans]|uniref:hypothetical protein n=1 Tax=Terrabacter carboxydivorans TaxID=619730 RepID=UPI0031D28A79